MSLLEIKKNYQSGKIPKQEYIDKMYKFHTFLFEYSKLLSNTEIESIEIIDGHVLMTSRETGITVLCDRADKRIAPIEALNFDFYEKLESEMMYRLVDPNFNVFDIGANIGWYTLSISKLFRNAKVFAFEPVPSTFIQLKANVELNNIKNVRIYNFGFSDREGEQTFYFEPQTSVSASSGNLFDSEDVGEVTCHVKRLDDFVLEIGVQPNFIKCDVEGAELLVYQGGIESITRFKPIIFTEMLRKWSARFNYHPNQLIELLGGVGYRCFVVKGENLVEFYKMDEDTLETNFFFLHSIKHASKIERLLKVS